MRSVRVFLLLALTAGCSAAVPCDPLKSGECDKTESCDTATRTCVSLNKCKDDSECKDGFGCVSLSQIWGSYCVRNCTSGGSPSSIYCAPGFLCDDPSRTCRSVIGQPCKTETSYYDCNGPNCDAATSRCVENRRCTEASECANGYGCGAKGCYRFCTSEVSSCQPGRTCDLQTATCK